MYFPFWVGARDACPAQQNADLTPPHENWQNLRGKVEFNPLRSRTAITRKESKSPCSAPLRTALLDFSFVCFLFCAPLPLSLNLCNVSRVCFIKRRKAEVLSCSAWADPGVGEKPEQVERKPKVARKDFFLQICRCGSLMFC